MKTYTRHDVATEVLYETTLSVVDHHMPVQIPNEVCDRIDGNASNCSLCCHITTRVAGVARFFMHRNPYVLMYIPCRYAKRQPGE